MQIQCLVPIAAAVLTLGAVPASAHAFLITASPGVGTTVAQPPREVVIDFTEGVEPLFSTIAVSDGAGGRVDIGKPHLEGGDAHLAVALKPLAPGAYEVTWHATATDTHKTQGSFGFVVK